MIKEMHSGNYEMGNYVDDFSEFREINFKNIAIPKTPVTCRSCASHKPNSTTMRPVKLVVKRGKNVEAYNIFVLCKCSTCNQVAYIRYSDYMRQISLTPPKKVNEKEKSERERKIIEQVYKCSAEEASEIQKQHQAERKKTLAKMRQESEVRFSDYEEEARKRKSEEKKALIASGELLYDRRNKVFYYKSTGKVYR